MSDCSEIGCKYGFAEDGKGRLLYGCYHGCGDVVPVDSMQPKEIADAIKQHIKDEKEKRKFDDDCANETIAKLKQGLLDAEEKRD